MRVRSPVWTTTPRPAPATTVDPSHAMLGASMYIMAVPAADMGTGSDSPVRGALLSDRPAQARMRMSAGTLSPVSSSTMSPRTRSAAGTCTSGARGGGEVWMRKEI
jgi:hypothetical protein